RRVRRFRRGHSGLQLSDRHGFAALPQCCENCVLQFAVVPALHLPLSLVSMSYHRGYPVGLTIGTPPTRDPPRTAEPLRRATAPPRRTAGAAATHFASRRDALRELPLCITLLQRVVFRDDLVSLVPHSDSDLRIHRTRLPHPRPQTLERDSESDTSGRRRGPDGSDRALQPPRDEHRHDRHG